MPDNHNIKINKNDFVQSGLVIYDAPFGTIKTKYNRKSEQCEVTLSISCNIIDDLSFFVYLGDDAKKLHARMRKTPICVNHDSAFELYKGDIQEMFELCFITMQMCSNNLSALHELPRIDDSKHVDSFLQRKKYNIEQMDVFAKKELASRLVLEQLQDIINIDMEERL